MAWADEAQAQKAWTLDRDGKMEAVLSEELPDEPGLRRIVRVTVRTSDASNQLYLEPDVSVKGWITSLPAAVASEQQIMALYSDHVTSEQFHSEFKTDLGLNRLPSGKFNTNNLVMAFATLGYNLLRWMGPEAHRPGRTSTPSGKTSSPEDSDAGADDHGLPHSSRQWLL